MRRLPTAESVTVTISKQTASHSTKHLVVANYSTTVATMSSTAPMIAGTLQTDPRSGGLKRSSGVNVLPIVAETWAQVRDNSNNNVDWLIAGYDNGSKTDITVLQSGSGGVVACAQALPEGEPVFGGFKTSSGRFRQFYFASEGTSVMKKGRASMHKNGVLNTLEGCDGEVEMKLGMTETDI